MSTVSILVETNAFRYQDSVMVITSKMDNASTVSTDSNLETEIVLILTAKSQLKMSVVHVLQNIDSIIMAYVNSLIPTAQPSRVMPVTTVRLGFTSISMEFV